jgi:hypothetical protein
VLIGALATSFGSAVAMSELPAQTRSVVQEATAGGVAIVPAASVDDLAVFSRSIPTEVAGRPRGEDIEDPSVEEEP